MLQPLSRLEESRRETLISLSSSAAFSRVAALWGIPKPHYYPLAGWRSGTRENAVGPRGTLAAMFAMVRGAFSSFEVSYPATVVLGAPDYVDFNPINPTCATGRLWDIDGAIYWSVDQPAGPVLTFAEVETPYFEAFAPAAGGGVTATLLPFVIEEREPCVYTVLLDGELLGVPPSYLMDPAGDDRLTVAPGQPYGAQLVDPDDGDPSTPVEGSQVTGPFPLYLADDDLASQPVGRVLDSLLAAGVRLELLSYDFCNQ